MVKRKTRKKIIDIFLTAVQHCMQFTCGSKQRYATRRVSIIQPFQRKHFISHFVSLGSSWTARAKLLLSGLNVALFTALHTCDVSHHMTWIGTFSKWPSIKHQKNLQQIWFCTIYRLFAYLGFFNRREIYQDKKRGRTYRQLPFKSPSRKRCQI